MLVKFIFAIPVFFALMSPITAIAAVAEKKGNSDELLAKIESVPDGESGLNKGEQEPVKQVSEYGAEAVSRLVALLKHPDEDVAAIAAAALGDCERIDREYLAQIVAGLDREIRWLPRALGRIQSDEAADEAVNRYLEGSTSPGNQEAYTLGNKRIAIAGLAHMVSNDGLVFEILREADSKWDAEPWRALPGAPRSSEITGSVEILISTHSRGNVILSEDGTMRMARRSDQGSPKD